jgi:hypothetical protein
MSAERRVQHGADEKEEMEGRSLFLLEKLSRQIEARNELAVGANALAKKANEMSKQRTEAAIKRMEALQTYVKHFEKVVSVRQLRT